MRAEHVHDSSRSSDNPRNATASLSRARERFDRIERATDLPLALLALLIVPALVLEERATSPLLRQTAHAINWIVWIAFCAEYVGKWLFAPDRRSFVRSSWFDLVIIVLSPPFLVPDAMQGARVVRVLRLLRFARAAAVAAIGLREAAQGLRHRSFHYVALATLVVIGLGAAGIFAVERGQNTNLRSIDDALWWAIVTTTTVGYGDVSPVTGEGRLIAVALMIVGIGFIGVFTATLTSFFLEPAQKGDPNEEIRGRLAALEEKIDRLLEKRERL